MSKLKYRRHTPPRDGSEPFTDFPTWANLAPLVDTHLIRLEDRIQDGHYVIRAELSGIDRAKDITITVADGPLTIKLEHAEGTEPEGRSEFSYGSFVRTVTLPTGVDGDDITASYDKGILTISVAMPEAPPPEKRIPVRTGS